MSEELGHLLNALDNETLTVNPFTGDLIDEDGDAYDQADISNWIAEAKAAMSILETLVKIMEWAKTYKN
jgi:hypothetical protein